MRSQLIALKKMLGDLGMSPRGSRKVMSLEIGDGIFGVVDLPVANYPGSLSIAPTVGVSERTMGEVFCELTNTQYEPTACLFVADNVGYLSPHNTYRYYIFEAGAPYENIAQELVADVRSFALPFFEAHSSLPAIFEKMLLTERPGIPNLKIPVGYHVIGDDKSALESLEKQISKFRGVPSAAFDEYKAFAERLTRRISQVH